MFEFQYKGKLSGYNQRYIKGYILAPVYRKFKEAVRIEFKKKYLGFKPLLGDVAVTIEYNSRHDADNITKAINDSLEGYAFLNDNQIVDLHILKNKNIEKGFKITIYNTGVI